MKRIFLFSLSFILLIGLPSPSHSLFGLSKCEKLTKELNREQSIGFQSWKVFDNQRDALIKRGNFNGLELRDILNKLKIVLLSDLQIYKSIENNSNCFKVNKVSKNRQKLDDTKDFLDQIAISNASILKWSAGQKQRAVTPELFTFVKNYYVDFFDWSSGKKLN